MRPTFLTTSLLARITNLRSIINFYQQETIDSQLQLATLKYENEKLSCENEKLKRMINIKDQLLNKYKVKLRGARCLNTKLRKNILDAKKEVINKDHKFVLKNTFGTRKSISRRLQVSPLDTSTRTTEFMAKVRFLQHTCLLSFQKASMVIDLCFNVLFQTTACTFCTFCSNSFFMECNSWWGWQNKLKEKVCR